jgi:hypothetical protein
LAILNKTKLYKKLNFLFKWFVAIAAMVTIWLQLKHLGTEDLKQLLVIGSGHFMLFVTAFFLIIVNWGIETVKWKSLIHPIQPLGYRKAVQSVLFGVSVSMFTPNRIGDIGGRLLYIPSSKRPAVAFMNVICAASQWMITIVFGLIALLFLLERTLAVFGTVPVVFFVITGLLTFFLPPLIWSYRLRIWKWITKWKWMERRLQVFKPNDGIAPKLWINVLFYSLLRYAVFSLQYGLLLHFFGVVIPVHYMFCLIAGVFFINTVLPSGIITSLGIRGSAALALFGLWSGNSEGIIAATFVLWFFNLVLPAIAGSFFTNRLTLLSMPAKQ